MVFLQDDSQTCCSGTAVAEVLSNYNKCSRTYIRKRLTAERGKTRKRLFQFAKVQRVKDVLFTRDDFTAQINFGEFPTPFPVIIGKVRILFHDTVHIT